MDFHFTEVQNLGEDEEVKCLYRGDVEDSPENKNVTVEDGIVEIGESAFKGCTGLTSITLPAHITNIDELDIPKGTRIIRENV